MNAQNEYRLNTKPNGFSIGSKSSTKLNIDHNVNAFTLEESNRDGLEGQFVTLSGIHINNEAGAPNLPSSSTFVAIPNGAEPSIQLVSAKTKVIENVDLIPAPKPQLENDDSPAVYEKDMTIYGRNALYPESPFKLSEVTTVRGVEMVQVGVMPFQYNPVTKELIVYEDLELELTTEGGNGTYGDIRYRTPEWDQILQDILLNREVLPEVDYGAKLRKHYENRETGCEYIIITPDNEEFVQLADSIKKFRTNQGIPTEVFTVTQCGGNNQTSIRNFIRNAYNNWDMPPAAVLILGDHDTDATQGVVSYTMNNHPGSGYNPYISDHKYAVMGNDHMPNVIIGRITGRNHEELYHMIKKDLDYERTPPTNPGFYDRPITAMGFQLERWFQLCSEVVNGFWEHGLGKHPVRINAIYQGTPGSQWSSAQKTNTIVNFFGPNGLGYIPQNMSHLTDWDGNADMINQCINEGAFLLQHRDHGAEELWGEPRYSISNIKRLTNNDLTFVMSNNCLTGRFNYSGMTGEGCFAEVFHRHQHGALGLIAATQVSYSFVNDVYVWGSYDNMWPDFMPSYGTQHASNFILPAFANAAGKFFLQQSNWTDSSVKEITYYLFHHHGDAYMNLYSEMPQQLDVEMLPVLVANSDQYQVKVDEGATICLTANSQIIGFGEGTGSTQTITVTPQEEGTRVTLTITKQNYYRYEHELATISSTEPYLIFNALEINDAEGNNNQLPDYNETCHFNLSIHNVGFATIDNVHANLTTSHPEVQIIDNEAVYGTINIGETPMVNNAFTIHLGEGINDQESVWLFLQLGNNDFVFHDSIRLIVNAPVLSCTNVSFSDLNGQPTDRLFSGESTLMTFEISNSGHSRSLDITNSLAFHAPFLNISEDTLPLNGIEAGETGQTTFQVNLLDEAPKGSYLNYVMTTQSGIRTSQYSSLALLGYTTEDFEDDELNVYILWSLGTGTKKWHIVEDETATEGHCLSSPTLNDNSSAKLSVGFTCDVPSTFTFSHKTSTEENDVLNLVVNGQEVGSWGGISDWEESTFDLKQGSNLIKFTFRKDAQNSGGDDRVMIDHLLFPPIAELFVQLDDEAERCSSEPYTPNGYILNAQTIAWTTDGDGSFDDPTIENPTYTYGPNDLYNGQVTLNMTATTGINNVQQSKDILINVTEDFTNVSPAMPTGEMQVNPETTTTTIYHANLPQRFDYVWTLTPEEAGSIEPENEAVTIHWNSQYLGDATLHYQVSNNCGESEISQPLDIELTLYASVDSHDGISATSVYPNPAHGILNIKANDLSGQVSIRLIDALGRVVVTKVGSVEGNTLEEHINTESLDKGIYNLQITDGNQTVNTRVILQ